MQRVINSRAFRWISAIGWAALIAYLMLSPGEESPVEELSGFFGGTELSDWVGHVGLFGAFTLLMYRVASEDERTVAGLIGCVMFALVYGALTELLQSTVPNRGATLIDMVGNWLGVVIMGAVLSRVN